MTEKNKNIVKAINRNVRGTIPSVANIPPKGNARNPKPNRIVPIANFIGALGSISFFFRCFQIKLKILVAHMFYLKKD